MAQYFISLREGCRSHPSQRSSQMWGPHHISSWNSGINNKTYSLLCAGLNGGRAIRTSRRGLTRGLYLSSKETFWHGVEEESTEGLAKFLLWQLLWLPAVQGDICGGQCICGGLSSSSLSSPVSGLSSHPQMHSGIWQRGEGTSELMNFNLLGNATINTP